MYEAALSNLGNLHCGYLYHYVFERSCSVSSFANYLFLCFLNVMDNVSYVGFRNYTN